ncbi:MAG TPA: P-loop NTPase fold protein [Candidatus Deferrimicrobium sp.]|nr:P-loop NTPase fold protein [Candidatus Deferrimicrobium sp.]
MFKADQPIKSYKEDILSRHSFSQSLGNAILSYKEKESIAIGLHGTWGSGKTSIINMVLEYIDNESAKQNDNKKPIIMRFNPWNYSDQNQLVSQFFIQLSAVLNRTDHASDAKKAGKKLNIYANFFKPFTLVPTIGLFASLFSNVFKFIGNAARDWGDAMSKDIAAIREELNKLLANQPHKIIVVIDDIDRLNNTEIRQVFQLIKTLGDFPNTIYLLAFDRNVVINALEKVQEGPGEEYLEKVIQIPFEIPLISKQEVGQLLFGQLDALIKNIPKNKWDQSYWSNIYLSGLKYFFENIRDVTRYINSIRFSFEMVLGEVNPVDFFAIVGIQVFIPEVYYGIRDNKDIFSGIFERELGSGNETKDQAKKRCDEIIGKVNEPLQTNLKDFLKRLFPKLESIYGNTNYNFDWLCKWRRDCRICSPDIFDIFFRLSISNGEISTEEIETILSIGENLCSLTDALLKLNEDGRIIRFLERLEDYTRSEIPNESIESIITVLMNIGDLFPEGELSFFGTETSMKLLRLFYQLSHRFDNHDKRFSVFKSAMEKANRSLYTIVNEVSVQDQLHGKYGSNEPPQPEEKLTVKAEQLEKLKKIACEKIEIWAEDGRLNKHKKLLSILYCWRQWGAEDKVTKFINDMIKNDDGLIDFITSFLSKSTSHSLSDYVSTIHWHIDLKLVEEFVNIKEVEPRIRKIFSSAEYTEFEDQRKLAIKKFIETIDGKIKDPFEYELDASDN